MLRSCKVNVKQPSDYLLYYSCMSEAAAEQAVSAPQPAQPEGERSPASMAAEPGVKASFGATEKLAPAPARLSETVTVLTHGWRAYSQEQIHKGRWTAEQVAHPEQKLLPEMNSKEIKQGMRE